MSAWSVLVRGVNCAGCLRQRLVQPSLQTHHIPAAASLYTKSWAGRHEPRVLCHTQRQVCHYRSVSSTSAPTPRIAVIGSGPAGFYTAQQILKGHPSATVDIYEKLPVPFGLVRFGVAPDHLEVKNVINTFTQTAHHERCSYLGNVTVGRDITVAELRQAYTALVLAYGADNDKTFEIPGEGLPEVLSARSFVGWYNGLPENSQLSPPLSRGDTAIVLGQGNVAVDVARILLTPVDILRKTDITEYALEALSNSQVRRVLLVGRRGPLQVALTVAELREMTRLPGCRPLLYPSDFLGIKEHIKDIPRRRKRLTELMVNTALNEPSEEQTARWDAADKEWGLVFHRSPSEFMENGGHLTGIRCNVNRLEGPAGENQKAVATEETEDLPCSLVFRSIGYKSSQLAEEVPFDSRVGIVPNIAGKVSEQTGMYCSGWVKTGPVGVIVSTMNSSFETGKNVLNDLNEGKLVASEEHTGLERILPILKERCIYPVDFSEWEKVDKVEKERGSAMDKPREKIVDVEEMLKAARH